jgi:transcriptional regulator with XRE-family HTH domain
MARNKRTTIYDIARHLNLSPGTISKIMNGKDNVPPATRDKVLSYIKEINFVANINARNLKSSRSYTIGIVFHDLAFFGLEHPFFSGILQAFKNYVEAKGYEIVFIVEFEVITLKPDIPDINIFESSDLINKPPEVDIPVAVELFVYDAVDSIGI